MLVETNADAQTRCCRPEDAEGLWHIQPARGRRVRLPDVDFGTPPSDSLRRRGEGESITPHEYALF